MARSENNLRAVLQDTADAIRGKTGSQEAICPRDFADEIEAIPVGITPSGTFSITDNGEYDITEYAYVDVEVESGETLEENHIYQYTSEYGLVDQYANDRGNYTFYEDELRLNDTSSDGVYYFDWNNMPQLKSLDNGSVYIYQGGSSFETLDLPEFVDETFYLYTESNGLTDAGIQTESFYYFGSSAQYYEVLTEGEGVYYFDGDDYLSNKYLESDRTYYYSGGSDFSDMGIMNPGIYSVYEHYANEISLDSSKLYRPFIGSGPMELREEEWYNDMLELEVGGSVNFTVEDSSGTQYSFTATRTA